MAAADAAGPEDRMRLPITVLLVMAVSTWAPGCSSKSTLNRSPDAASSGGGGGQTPGTGGVAGLPSTGGSPGTGGRTSTGGAPGTGGTSQVSDGAVSDGRACTCSSRAVTWACYCSAYDCSRTLASYRPDGGMPTSVRVIREYADCNLAVVTTKMGAD